MNSSKGQKRTRKGHIKNTPNELTETLTKEFRDSCQKEFESKAENIIARNAISMVGTMFATTNVDRANNINYVFMNSVKKRNLKATNQGHSGRCWMFAALNTFRHLVINAMNMENFEFSQTYLFFWDKFERSHTFLMWFVDNITKPDTDREYSFMIEEYRGDGGYWNMFSGLIEKYGIIPKDAMKETANSGNSEEMNEMINHHLDDCVAFFRKNKHRSRKFLLEKENKVMKHIYSILVKFLGQPPKEVSWAMSTEDDEPQIFSGLSPLQFKQLTMPSMNINNDFIVLVNMPHLDYYQNYKLNGAKNIYNGPDCMFFNVPMNELTRYTTKSVLSGIAVWFAGDVSKHFNWWHSTLDDELDQSEKVFGTTKNFSKGERMLLRNVQANHAMAFTGVNLDEKKKPMEWQVENSWGYWDNETPGMDGFLTMSQSWFEKYVIMTVIHRKLLTKTMERKSLREPKTLNCWDFITPALKVRVVNPPIKYLNLRKSSK